MDTNLNINTTHKTSTAKVTGDVDKAKLRKAAEGFESMFVNYLLQTMRKSVHKENEEGEENFGGDMMQEMFDLELSKNISRNSNLGIGEMMYKKMTGEEYPKQAVKNIIDAERVPKVTIQKESSAVVSPIPVAQPKAVKKEEKIKTEQINKTEKLEITLPVHQQKISKNIKANIGQYDDMINRAAAKYNVDSSLIKAIMASESAGNSRAHSSANAKGLMQLIDTTATMMGVKNVWDPEQNIHGGAKYLKQLLDKFDGDVHLAVASYNAGPANIEKTKKIPAIPETQNYVKKVMQYLDVFSSAEE